MTIYIFGHLSSTDALETSSNITSGFIGRFFFLSTKQKCCCLVITVHCFLVIPLVLSRKASVCWVSCVLTQRELLIEKKESGCRPLCSCQSLRSGWGHHCTSPVCWWCRCTLSGSGPLGWFHWLWGIPGRPRWMPDQWTVLWAGPAYVGEENQVTQLQKSIHVYIYH